MNKLFFQTQTCLRSSVINPKSEKNKERKENLAFF